MIRTTYTNIIVLLFFNFLFGSCLTDEPTTPKIKGLDITSFKEHELLKFENLRINSDTNRQAFLELFVSGSGLKNQLRENGFFDLVISTSWTIPITEDSTIVLVEKKEERSVGEKKYMHQDREQSFYLSGGIRYSQIPLNAGTYESQLSVNIVSKLGDTLLQLAGKYEVAIPMRYQVKLTFEDYAIGYKGRQAGDFLNAIDIYLTIKRNKMRLLENEAPLVFQTTPKKNKPIDLEYLNKTLAPLILAANEPLIVSFWDQDKGGKTPFGDVNKDDIIQTFSFTLESIREKQQNSKDSLITFSRTYEKGKRDEGTNKLVLKVAAHPYTYN